MGKMMFCLLCNEEAELLSGTPLGPCYCACGGMFQPLHTITATKDTGWGTLKASDYYNDDIGEDETEEEYWERQMSKRGWSMPVDWDAASADNMTDAELQKMFDDMVLEERPSEEKTQILTCQCLNIAGHAKYCSLYGRE